MIEKDLLSTVTNKMFSKNMYVYGLPLMNIHKYISYVTWTKYMYSVVNIENLFVSIHLLKVADIYINSISHKLQGIADTL